MDRPRAVLAEDFDRVRQAFADLLAPDLDIVASVADGEAALKAVQEFQPDLVLLDISMPVLDGMSAARKLKQIMPQVKIIFLTMHAEPAYIREADFIGAEGFVLKHRASAELREAIHAVMAGHRYFPPAKMALRA